MHNATYSGPVRDDAELTAACEKDEESDPACYEEHLFKETWPYAVLHVLQVEGQLKSVFFWAGIFDWRFAFTLALKPFVKMYTTFTGFKL